MPTITYAPNPLDCTLGRGVVLFNRFDASLNKGAYILVGNCSEFKVTPTDDVKEVYNYMVPDGGLYTSAVARRKVQISMKLWEWNEQNVALGTVGDLNYLTQSSATVTAEAITPAAGLVLGGVYQTLKRKISATTLHQGATILVLGTDYVIYDSDEGLIQILPTSVTATAGSALTLDYTAAAITAQNQPIVAPFTHPQLFGSIKFIGKPAQGKIWRATFWHTQLNPKDLGSLIGDDFATFDLDVRLLNDAAGQYGGSATYPYAQLVSGGDQ